MIFVMSMHGHVYFYCEFPGELIMAEPLLLLSAL